MTRRNKRLIFITLIATALTAYVGCSQPEDVLVRVSTTDIYFDVVQNLPSTYDGMIYELWLANDDDTVSAGKFGYDHDNHLFLNTDGQEKSDSNYFRFNGDTYDYDVMFVSVEPSPDPDPGSPSAIMLIDFSSNPEEDAMKLIFPEIADTIPLWSALVRFSMETVSDDSTYIKPGPIGTIFNTRDTATNGYGIWFANYSRIQDSLRDSIQGNLDSIELEILNIIEDTVVISIREILNIHLDTIERTFGLDTFTQVVVRFDSVIFIDSTIPESSYVPHWTFTTAPPIFADIALDEPPRTMYVDTFTQDNFRLPNFEPYGWTYKAWVVSPLIDTSAGHFNPPGWEMPYNDTATGLIEIPGDYGGILSFGTFGWIEEPDDDNLYTKSDRVPSVPGDEFWENLPGGLAPVNLVPNAFGNTGTVFITLEPIDLQVPNAKTNFPLLAFIRPLPTTRAEVTADQQQFTMNNRTSWTLSERGFPMIIISINRY